MESKRHILYADRKLYGTPAPSGFFLRVEVSEAGFSFSIADDGGQYLAVGNMPFSFRVSPRRLLEWMIRFFETVPPLCSLRFVRTTLIYIDCNFTVLPLPLFDSGKKAHYLSFSLGRDIRENVLHDVVDRADAVTVFAAHRETSDYFTSRSEEVRQCHGATVFLEKALDSGVNGRKTLHLNATGGHLQAVALDGPKTTMNNIFKIDRPTDWMYYALLAANRIENAGEGLQHVFYGDSQIYQDNLSGINRYLGDYHFADRIPGTAFSPALDFVAGHEYCNLLTGAPCES